MADETARDELARACDPAAFEDHPIEARRPVAALQWGARRFQAREVADRLLTSDWLESVRAAVWDEGYGDDDTVTPRVNPYRKTGGSE